MNRITLGAFLLVFTVTAFSQPDVRVRELPDDPYIAVDRDAMPRSPAYRSVSSGFFMSQANVDSDGNNIVGDAGNEPSIAVDPNDYTRVAIGWRQFDTITNNFRQAGYGYTADGGITWTFPGVIEPGIFRSDPVLDFDSDGAFYYNSLTSNGGNFSCDVFKSTDGGATWDGGTFAWGGDKQWMTIDRTGGMGEGNNYSNWTVFFSSCEPGHFTRSSDHSQSFEACVEIPGQPYWGTLSVGPDGDLYIGGADFMGGFQVIKSSNARDSTQTVSFDDPVAVDLGGEVAGNQGFNSPNPDGILGQVWVATDHSDGPTRGNVYLLCSAEPDNSSDPLDVMFARSTDGGQTWSEPVRVNDDVGDEWQWFGTMSVAPDGRIDVIWLDTRDDPGTVLSSLYYSFSRDAGVTWSVNERLSDEWDPHLGWPQQDKIGDYYDMVSDSAGAHLAWSATFNGEQDVYYGRIISEEFVPAAPALLSPPDGEEDQPLTLSLFWNASAGASSYRLQVDSAGTFASPLVDDSTLTVTSYELTNLVTGTGYFWRVNAKSDGGTSEWSETWSFTTSFDPPEPPALLSPPDGAGDVSVPVTFEWMDTASIATWDLQVATDEGFTLLVLDTVDLQVPSHVADMLEGETTHYWRVRTNNVGGTSLWSSAWSFTTAVPPPAAPSLIAPPDGFVSGANSIFFRWEGVGDAETYHLQLATDDGFTTLVVNDSTLDGNTLFVSDLVDGTIYYWRVSASNVSGTSAWSEVWSFSVVLASVDDEELLPSDYVLNQNYPNPFNPSTVIRFGVPEKTPVLIEVFDVVGKRVAVLADRTYEAGYYDVSFDAGNLGAGVYFYRLTATEFVETRKLLLLR